MAHTAERLSLPLPALKSQHSLEELLKQRHSVREFPNQALSLEQLGQLLWAAQGITHGNGYRTAPSAGALYPLELYIVVGQVIGLEPGVYHYRPRGHELVKTLDGDLREPLAEAAMSQESLVQAPIVILFAAVPARSERKYGQRALRYIYIEAGHAAENLYLQAEAVGLATVDVGAFHDNDVAQVLQLPEDQIPILLMPVGRK